MTDSKFQPYSFSDPREQRIHDRLLLLGASLADLFEDACRLMDSGTLKSTTHIVSHLMREIESGIRAVLDPNELKDDSDSQNGKHKKIILAIVGALDIPKSDPVTSAWLDLGLHGRAHRGPLAALRALDDEFREFWGKTLWVLDTVLERFESNYLTYHDRLDELLRIATPAGRMRKY